MAVNSLPAPWVSAQASGVADNRVQVPWSTVLPLAIVMAYADGFWMITSRTAVGAIERTQTPFASWWRESTVAVPVYVLAVLGALTLALRWFSLGRRTAGRTALTALLIAGAGTVTGTVLVAASAAYDYHLQSLQMTMMNSMHGLCITSCLAQAQQATLSAQITAAAFASGLLMVTNLVLVGWLVAMRGGRLDLALIAPRRSGGIFGRFTAGGRVGDLRFLLAAALVGGAAIHGAAVSEHLTEWSAAGAFFIVLAMVEIAAAAVLLFRATDGAVIAAGIISIGPLGLWLYSRTAGLPFGPGAGAPERIGLADSVTGALEITALVIAVALLRGRRFAPRPPISAHLRSLALVAVFAATAIGLAASAPQWFDSSGADSLSHTAALSLGTGHQAGPTAHLA